MAATGWRGSWPGSSAASRSNTARSSRPGGHRPRLESISQFEYWSNTHLTVDLVKGRGSGFSLEAPEGFRFMIRSRLFTEEELAELAAPSH